MAPGVYSNDLSDAEWTIVEPLLPDGHRLGRPRKWSWRQILNGIFYILRSGGAWRLMPHDLPPWQTVYHYHRIWRLQGVWARIHTALRELVRLRAGREATPSAAIIDSQTVRTTESGGSRGYDGGKKINGRKRHLLVDTLGLVMAVKVHTADLQDRAGAPLLLSGLNSVFPRMRHVWADAGYTGKLIAAVQQTLGWTLEAGRRAQARPFCPRHRQASVVGQPVGLGTHRSAPTAP